MVDIEENFLTRFPALMRANAFRTYVLPTGTTKFRELCKRGILETRYVDGTLYVVVASAAKLIANSPTDADGKRVVAAARARKGKISEVA